MMKICSEVNPLHMEGVVVAADEEGAMVEVMDRDRGKSYYLFTPFAMMPPRLRAAIGVGLVVYVHSWYEPGDLSCMQVSMSTTSAELLRHADPS